MINTKKDRENLYLRLTKLDLVTKFKDLLKTTYHARMEDGKFVPRMPSMGIEAPWI